jgi:AraC-like DNA-binding protein
MPGSGMRTFLDPDRYEASLRHAQIELLVTPHGKFRARLTWVELHHLRLLHCEEDFSRIAYLSLTPGLAFVAFTTGSGALPVWGGRQVRAGDVMLHGPGERLHQSASGPVSWSLIALDPDRLEHYGRALSGRPLVPPPEGRLLRPLTRNTARLRRLHAQACRLAETRPKILAHSEVARAIEQGLIQALVPCLSAAKTEEDAPIRHRRVRIMISFEEALAEHLCRPLRMSELCELVGVSELTLRSCCAEFIGISPSRYLLLRRLKQVRMALRDADPKTADVAELAGRYGFIEPGRFAEVYREVFGEPPSATLRPPETRFIDL